MNNIWYTRISGTAYSKKARQSISWYWKAQISPSRAIIIDKTVQPKVQAQRRIPFPKRKQFDEIIQELEDIIEQVEGPTEWISNVVLTPKSNPTQIRMNIDMTTANTAIKRTRHVIPTLEELRYKLNGAKHFTKLDMKQGYMQLELKPESRYITKFYTQRTSSVQTIEF